MGETPRYVDVFGSDPLKRLHGCAVAEVDRGAASPCAGLARADHRPQIGFGNPHAPLLFLSPSPIDPESPTGQPFSEWVEHEAALPHHLISERVTPYFRFARAVLRATRERWNQPPVKGDVLDLVFHSWVARCATANPDRVTAQAIDQCSSRHLGALIQALAPGVIVALGGATAHYFWIQAGRDYATWQPIERLHGTTLSFTTDGRTIPVVLSIHPFQRDLALHPDVIARAITAVLAPGDLKPALKAA